MVSSLPSVGNPGCCTPTAGIRIACRRLQTLRKAWPQHFYPSPLPAKSENDWGTHSITATLEATQIQRSCAAVVAAAALVLLHPLTAAAQVDLMPACYTDMLFSPT